MKVGDWVRTKKEIVFNFDGNGEVRLHHGILGRITCKVSSHDRLANVCSIPVFEVKIPVIPNLVSVTVCLREDELAFFC